MEGENNEPDQSGENSEQNQPQNNDQNTDQGVDLESLLSEYDEDTSSSESGNNSQDSGDNSQDNQVDNNQISEILDYVRTKRQQDQAQETEQAVTKAVETIKGNETLASQPDWVIEGALHAQANKDPRIQRAFQNRQKDPEGWNKVLRGVGDKLAADMKEKPDEKLTEDRDAARAAVSGQKSSESNDAKPDPKELNSLSDEEFERKKAAGEFG